MQEYEFDPGNSLLIAVDTTPPEDKWKFTAPKPQTKFTTSELGLMYDDAREAFLKEFKPAKRI